MRTSLLLWDELHTIVPEREYKPFYKEAGMARAWELIGQAKVVNEEQKALAHRSIEEVLVRGIPPQLQYAGSIDRPCDAYEIWPQKFAIQTFDLMRQHGMTSDVLPNGDYPFSEEGGLLAMSKLADAYAGITLARTTDRLLAYGLIADNDDRTGMEDKAVSLTLEVIDTANIPLKKLIELREREKKERKGHHYTALRHNYADAIQSHINGLKIAKTKTDLDRLNQEFKSKMANDLKDLRDVLAINKSELLLKPVVVGAVVGAGSLLTAGFAGPAALLAAGTAALGTSLADNAKHVAEFFSSGISFGTKQREAMAKHPMAYMYTLSRV